MAVDRHRVFLFLQGPPSPFARQLSDELDRLGQRTLRINLSAGDWLYWRKRGAYNYRGKLADFPAYLETFCRREGVTDILYYADRLPYHRVAAAVARKLGICETTYEFGYLRPDWLTFERSGMSAYSHFPNDPDTIRAIAENAEDPDLTVRFPYSFNAESFNEVVYNMTTALFPWGYWHYDADKYYHPFIDYPSYLPRLVMSRINTIRARNLIRHLKRGGQPYYVFPMQMQSDYQLRANSPFRHQSEAMEMTIRSFAANASGDAWLIFKVHPLDNGLERWQRVLTRLATQYNVLDRVHLIDGGKLNLLLTHAAGTVLINSTVGLHAYRVGCPVKVLGMAIFDIAGLSFQGPLDDFWTNAEKPDPELLQAFIKAIGATIQVKGNFYTAAGRAEAAKSAAKRLIEGRINEPGAFVDPPPRLEEAKRRGVPFWSDEDVLAGRIK